MLSRRLGPGWRKAESGITLGELLVSMALATILGTLATMFFTVALHTGDKALYVNQGNADARVTLDSWTSMVRAAGWLDVNAKVDRFEEITPTKIVFYANLNNRTDPTSGTVIAGSTVNAVTKIALILRQPAGAGDGQLIEVRFASDNSTVSSIRQLVPHATQSNGAWLFTPYDRSGGPIDTSVSGCVNVHSQTAGLCAKAPAGAGMIDPTPAATGMSVASGPLRGDGSADAVLANVGRIDISFAVRNSAGTYSSVYASSASVNSGYPT